MFFSWSEVISPIISIGEILIWLYYHHPLRDNHSLWGSLHPWNKYIWLGEWLNEHPWKWYHVASTPQIMVSFALTVAALVSVIL